MNEENLTGEEKGQNGHILRLKNEFACVEVSIDETANGPRLLVRDVMHGVSVYMDPIVIESLTRMPSESYDTLFPF
jgi:hypothetical protein